MKKNFQKIKFSKIRHNLTKPTRSFTLVIEGTVNIRGFYFVSSPFNLAETTFHSQVSKNILQLPSTLNFQMEPAIAVSPLVREALHLSIDEASSGQQLHTAYQYEDWTLLQFAASTGDLTAVQMIISSGIDCDGVGIKQARGCRFFNSCHFFAHPS